MSYELNGDVHIWGQASVLNIQQRKHIFKSPYSNILNILIHIIYLSNLACRELPLLYNPGGVGGRFGTLTPADAELDWGPFSTEGVAAVVVVVKELETLPSMGKRGKFPTWLARIESLSFEEEEADDGGWGWWGMFALATGDSKWVGVVTCGGTAAKGTFSVGTLVLAGEEIDAGGNAGCGVVPLKSEPVKFKLAAVTSGTGEGVADIESRETSEILPPPMTAPTPLIKLPPPLLVVVLEVVIGWVVPEPWRPLNPEATRGLRLSKFWALNRPGDVFMCAAKLNWGDKCCNIPCKEQAIIM
jgi:hypothetical protein